MMEKKPMDELTKEYLETVTGQKFEDLDPEDVRSFLEMLEDE